MKPRSWYVAGCCAIRLERWEDACTCFRRSTNLDDNPEAWNNLATALLQINKDVEAKHALSIAIKESSKWKVWMNYMYVCVLLNDLQDAILAGIKVFSFISPKWQQPIEEPDFNIYHQLILKTIEEIKRNKNTFLEVRIFELVELMVNKSPSYHSWTVASKLYIAAKDYSKAFLMIECAYRHLKDDYKVYYDEKKFNQLCELGVELIRIADLDKNEELQKRGRMVGTAIVDNAKLDTSDLEHLKEELK